MKTALITGGSAGLGKITSETLAGLGYRVVIAARDEVKGQRVVREILEKHPSAEVEFAQVDMADYTSVAEFAEVIGSRFDQIDRLILNAGLFTSSVRKNDAGHEYMFAATHMGHFLLTHKLMPLLKRSDDPRLIVTSSVAHWVGNILDFNETIANPPRGDRFLLKQFLLYGRSKLANILFVNGLEKHLKDSNVKVFSFHPGGVKTEFYRQFPDLFVKLFFPFLISERKGADTQIFLATDDSENRNGGYWCRRKPGIRSRSSRSEKLTDDLWDFSKEAFGVSTFGEP